MRKHLTIGLLIAGILLAAIMFSSCGATYTASGTNVSKIDELALIEPHSIIFYYDNPKTGYSEASLTSASEELLTELITSTNYPFTDPVSADYGGEGAPIAKWIETFADLESSDIKNLRVPKALTELIKSTNHRYGIVVHAHGLSKATKRTIKQKWLNWWAMSSEQFLMNLSDTPQAIRWSMPSTRLSSTLKPTVSFTSTVSSPMPITH